MARIKGKGTGPEMNVRRAAHAIGLRFRLHRADLPGKPDLIFPKFRLALFVHGCFWHQHEGCRRASMPKSRTEYWHPKLQRNLDRDKRNQDALQGLGWRVETLWECEVSTQAAAEHKLGELISQ
jgi:DNA mismatch endonuclease (patch repair protein)